jgi:hypothetical protein
MLNVNYRIVGLTMKYYFIRHQHYSENTSVYGYGDFPEQIPYLATIVEADTLRKAQNKVKKLFPRVIFNSNSPVISHYLLSENDRFLDYYVKLPLNHDARLSPANQELHNSCVRMLEEVIA